MTTLTCGRPGEGATRERLCVIGRPSHRVNEGAAIPAILPDLREGGNSGTYSGFVKGDPIASTLAISPPGERATFGAMPELRHLFTPFRVGGLTLKNRIFSSGHAEAMAEDGKPGPRLRAYHEAKARGGAGLTIIGRSTSVHPSSPASAWNMIANHDESVVAGYRGVAEAVHRHDCRIMSQLTHMGRRSQSDVESWHVLLAPSQIPEKVHREVPHELEAEQIAMLVRAFGDAARRCREGRLDGIELSFAHNHLVDQFWSPLFNRRTDEYGGSLENRMRFGFEVLREIRRQVGRDWVVGARISGDEIARGLAASGLVDFLSIIGGAAHTLHLQALAVANMASPHGLFVPLAAAIK